MLMPAHAADGAEGDSAPAQSAIFSIVIPAYNEEEPIRGTVQACLEVAGSGDFGQRVGQVEVIVVDDGSHDRTAEIVSSFGDRVTLVRHPHNLGYGAALKTGFHAARGELLGFLDADGTCSPDQFPAMVRRLIEDQADLVVGMRMTRESRMPWIRRVGNHFYASLLSVLSGRMVRDAASGMRVFRRRVLGTLFPLPNGLSFTPAMTTKAIHEHLAIAELPIPYADRSGSSKLSVLRDGLRFLQVILTLVLIYNPLKLFAFAGVASMLVGFGLASAPIVDTLFGRVHAGEYYIYRLLASLCCFAGGAALMADGLVATVVMGLLFLGRQYGSLARLMLRNRLPQKLGLAGGLMAAVAVGFAAVLTHQHFWGGGIKIHWKWFVGASLLFVCGVQFLSAGLIVKLLDAYRNMRDSELE